MEAERLAGHRACARALSREGPVTPQFVSTLGQGITHKVLREEVGDAGLHTAITACDRRLRCYLVEPVPGKRRCRRCFAGTRERA